VEREGAPYKFIGDTPLPVLLAGGGGGNPLSELLRGSAGDVGLGGDNSDGDTMADDLSELLRAREGDWLVGDNVTDDLSELLRASAFESSGVFRDMACAALESSITESTIEPNPLILRRSGCGEGIPAL
jgi:hypothetical protein